MINKIGIAARIGLATACLVALLAAPAGASLPAGGRLVASIAMPTPGSVDDRLSAPSGSPTGRRGRSPASIPRTNAVIARIPTPDPASVVGVGAGAIWVTSFPGNSLTRIDPGATA